MAHAALGTDMQFLKTDKAAGVLSAVPAIVARLSRYALVSLSFAVVLAASPIVQYQLTDLGSAGAGKESFRYVYLISGSLLANQELDIKFDPLSTFKLVSGQAPSGFDLELFQPNIPPGESGDYSALALTDQLSISGRFSVDFIVMGSPPAVPGAQQFYVFSDSSSASVQIGPPATTSLAPLAGVPEPDTVSLCGWACAIAIAGGIRRKFRSAT